MVQTSLLLLLLVVPSLQEGYGGRFKPYVRIEPATATLKVGEHATFIAEMNYPAGRNETKQPVAWSVVEKNGGTVTAAGVYTAPKAQGTFHLKATRTDMDGMSATAVITVK